MKATEVFVEQVIIGVGALIIGLLPFAPELMAWWRANEDRLELEIVAIFGVLLVGACYLLGILLDRFIDTLLEGLDRHHRLRVALHHVQDEPDVPEEDPFPEGRFKMAVLMMGGEVASWHDYLRSRIRLTRFLAAALPGLTVSAVIATAPFSVEPGDVFLWLCGVYSVWFLLVLSRGRHLRSAPETRAGRSRLRGYAKHRGYLEPKSRARAVKRAWGLGLDVAMDPATLGAAALLISAFVLTSHYRSHGATTPWAWPIAGTLLTGLAGWSWWRIQQTHRRFLRRAGRAWKKTRKETPAGGTA